MSTPKPTKRIPNTKLDQIVIVRDESEELLAFENADAAYLFEACLGDSGYGSAYGGYEVERLDMDMVRRTEGYKAWVEGERHAITLAYMNYVSSRMDSDPDCDVSGDLLTMDETPKAYLEMTDRDFDFLFNDEEEVQDTLETA